MFEQAKLSKRVLIASAAIIILAAIAYSDSFNCSFNFDDYHQIFKNGHLAKIGNIPSFFYDPAASSFRDAKGYRPVLLGTFALNHAISGENVWSYHLFNLILHVLNAVLVFLTVTFVLDASGKKSFLIPLFVSLVFAVHPIQTDAVTYISARSVVLASFFCLLSFLSFLLFRRGGGNKVLWAILSPVFFVLGMLSKETAVCLPGLAIGYDFIFRAKSLKKLAGYLYYLAYILPLLAYLMLRRALLGYASVEAAYPRAIYMLSQIRRFPLYLRLMLFPFNQNADYNFPPTTTIGITVVLSAILIIFIFSSLLAMRNKMPAAAFFGLWFFIVFAPESSIFPILDITVEYRVYLALAGLIASIAILFSSFELRPGFVSKGAAVSVILLFAILTFGRNRVWATPATLWSDVSRKSPYSDRAWTNLGEALLDEGRDKEALGVLAKALESAPDERKSIIYTNMGCCYSDLGELEAARESFLKAIDADPTRVEARVDLGILYYRHGDYKDAVDALTGAVNVNPGYAKAHYELSLALYAMGDNGDAAREMEKAKELD